MNLDSSKSIFYHNFDCGPHRASNLDIHKLNTNNLLIQKLIMNQVELLEILMKITNSFTLEDIMPAFHSKEFHTIYAQYSMANFTHTTIAKLTV